jgi:CRP-like cAMP-binding protein
MIPTVERILFLQAIPLFETFSVDELWQVAQALDEMSYAPGEMLFEEGKPAHAMYLIVSGKVEASVIGKTIATLGKESILGDVAILDGMPYAVSVTAKDEVVAIKIEREKFEDILDANPGAARGVIRVLTRKLRYFSQQVLEAYQGKKMSTDPMDLTELKL